MRVIGRSEVSRLLDYRACIELVGKAMADLSAGRSKQMLRQVIPVARDNVLSVMGGVMSPQIGFGSKVISVFPENARYGRQAHQGIVVLFDPETGTPLSAIHAGELTRIRTAAASAVAVDALARPESSRLAVLGYGEQGQAHAEAMTFVRPISSVKIWGRSSERARRVADELSRSLNLLVEPVDTVVEAVWEADIVCTTTAAADPILQGKWIADGTHVSLVGSSVAAYAEADTDLVKRARFFADHREGVLRQGGEYLRAYAAGIVDEKHILGEIGEVLNGRLPGRITDRDVTVYKSLGHIVQDIVCSRYVHDLAAQRGAGVSVTF